MALVTAVCECGNTWQTIAETPDWDYVKRLGFCPDCADRSKPWNADIDERHLTNKPGWRRVNLEAALPETTA